MIHKEILDKDFDGFALTDEAEFEWERVGSIFNIWSNKTLRERFFGEANEEKQEADIFVWGRGEPTNKASTKFAGTPIYHEGIPHNLGYVGQLSLGDSNDLILKSIPGDLLVIWSDDEFPYGEIECRLVKGSEIEINENIPICAAVKHLEPFYGVRYRTWDPNWKRSDLSAEYELVGHFGPRLFRLWPWDATKVGGIPSNRDLCKPGNLFLGQLNSIQAEPEVEFPWVNQREPLPVSNAKGNGYSSQSNSFSFGDMGRLSFLLDDNGCVQVELEL